MSLSQERIREIERATGGQAQNPLWYDHRKNRLTASQFGRALTAYSSLGEYRSTHKLDEMRHVMVTSGYYTNPATIKYKDNFVPPTWSGATDIRFIRTYEDPKLKINAASWN